MNSIEISKQNIKQHLLAINSSRINFLIRDKTGSIIRVDGKDFDRKMVEEDSSLDKIYLDVDDLDLWQQICLTAAPLRGDKVVINTIGPEENRDGERLKKKINELKEFSHKEKKQKLVDDFEILEKLIFKKKNNLDDELVEQLLPITKNASMIAGVTMCQGDISKSSNKDNSLFEAQEVILSSQKNLHKIVNLITQNKKSKKLFVRNKEYRESDTISHCRRVFHTFTDFILHYNDLFEGNFIYKINRYFSTNLSKFKEFYQPFLPHKNIKELMDVVDGGLNPFSAKKIHQYAISAAYHDLGKLKNISYFESDLNRDEDAIQSHPYGLFDLFKDYKLDQEILQAASMHHELYGGGYGPYSTMIGQYMAINPEYKMNYVMTQDIQPILQDLKGFIPGFFPSKILEICDIYDALRNKRGYKTAKPIEKVLTIMQEDFFGSKESYISEEELMTLCYNNPIWKKYFIPSYNKTFRVKPYGKYAMEYDIQRLRPIVKNSIKAIKRKETVTDSAKKSVLQYQELLNLLSRVKQLPGQLDPIVYDIFIDYLSDIFNENLSRYKFTSKKDIFAA